MTSPAAVAYKYLKQIQKTEPEMVAGIAEAIRRFEKTIHAVSPPSSPPGPVPASRRSRILRQ